MSMDTRFRDPALVKDLVTQIRRSILPGKRYRFMEVCGSHTMAISKFGIRKLLPPEVELISGPGCPVCVTAQSEIDAIFTLLEQEHMTIVTFGDMLKVPGTGGRSLMKARAAGADVRVVFSPLDTLKLAAAEPAKRFLFLGIGFETTAPTVAALITMIVKTGAQNVFVMPMNKTMPEVIGVLLADSKLNIDGFIAPGHVTAVTGLGLYEPIVAAGKAAVVTGFEPVEVLSGIYEAVKQVNAGEFSIVNAYPRVVHSDGNPKAREIISEVFAKTDAVWRGLGTIPASGLTPKGGYARVNALAAFNVPLGSETEMPGCACGEVLKGYISPAECPLFRTVCTPENPIGPCMVSGEGSCSAYFKYQD